MRYLNSKEVANILGINISTLKRWTENGTLGCKKTAGGHRKFTIQHIRDYYKQHQEAGKKFGAALDNAEHKDIYSLIKSNDYNQLAIRLAETSIISDDLSVNTILHSSYMAGYNINDIFDLIVDPASDLVERWLCDENISHIEEYISRKLITRSVELLSESKPNGTFNGKSALCINFEDDLPDLGVAMSEVLLRHNGYNVFNTGSHAELGKLKNILKKYKIDTVLFYLCSRQCCRATALNNLKKTNNQVIEICDIAKDTGVTVIFGGEGIEHLGKIPKEVIKTFKSYDQLLSYL